MTIAPWGPISVDVGQDRSISVGELTVRMVRYKTSWRLYVEHAGHIASPSQNDGWRDLRLERAHGLRVEPAVPDLPVVLKPSEPIAVGPAADETFRILLPLWIRIWSEGAREPLLDTASKRLKKTWFGTPEAGELGYGWAFGPRSVETYQRHQFVVPLRVVNASQSVLWFERLLLRAVHLRLYQNGPRIESNGVTVRFKGGGQVSQVTFERDESMVARSAQLISERRAPVNPDIIRRSFTWLRDLTA
jgi:hypothetical protein